MVEVGWLLPGFWSCSQGFGVAPRVLESLLGFRVKCENSSEFI